MKFTGSSDDMFTRLFNDALYHRVRLGQSLQTFNKLREIGRVLGFNSDSDNRGDGELHDLHVVSLLTGGDGSGLHKELIDSNESTDVSGGDVLDSLNLSSHHQDGSLDGLLVQIILLAGHVVRAHDS